MARKNRQSEKIVVIGLDGGTWDLYDHLIRQGRMPTLAALKARGVSGILHSVVPPVTAPAWASFATGKNPGKHGVYDFRAYDPHTRSDHFVNSRTIRGRTIWQILSDNDKRVGVVNLPLMYPPYPVNGFTVAGFDTPSVKNVFTFPKELGPEILSMFPGYDFVPAWDGGAVEREKEFSELVERSAEIVDNLAHVSFHLMDKYPWDVFMVHFQVVDPIQHVLWRYLMEKEDQETSYGRRTKDIYTLLDRHLASFVERVEREGATLIILSDHGFGPDWGTIAINNLLEKYKFLSVRGRTLESIKRWTRDCRVPGIQGLYRAIKGLARPGKGSASGAKRWIEAQRERDIHDVLATDLLSVNWAKTRASAMMAIQAAYIYVNLRGREPGGVVSPGTEYEKVCDEIISKLAGAKSPDGIPLFREVCRPDRVYPDHDQNVADVIALPTPGYNLIRELSEAAFVPETGKQGSHRVEGMIFASGAGIPTGPDGMSANIVDVAPTILKLLGMPIPYDMDGKPITMICGEGAASYEDAVRTEGSDKDVYTPDEARTIENRLRGLGYL